jgi:Heparinase II/III-like protein
LPLDAMFREVNLGSFRGSWSDPLTTYLAFKGGSNQAHHGHLDLGTFVLDALGERWAQTLGHDSYELPDYFGKNRWSYYRCSTRGQNTITIDNRNQETDGKAAIINFRSGAERSQAIVNLSDAYRYDARRVMRGFALLNRRQVLVQDEIDLQHTADLAWSFHTTAQIEVEGSVAHLRQNGKELTVRILAPLYGKFEVFSGNPPPPQLQTPNLKKLTIRLHDIRGHVQIAVLFSPGESEAELPAIVPLERWELR